MRILLVALALLAAPAARSATILDLLPGDIFNSVTLGSFSSHSEPLGQTFTTTQDYTNITAGAFFEDVNAFTAPTFEVTMRLYQGFGFGGSVLATETFTLPDGFIGLFVTNFTSLGVLSAGDYTLGFQSPGARGALVGSGLPVNDPARIASVAYEAGGPLGVKNPFRADFDFATIVLSQTAVIPLPAPAVLLGAAVAGLAGMGIRRRRCQAA